MRYLLARGQLGHAEKERILRAALAGSRGAPRVPLGVRRHRWIPAGALALVALAAAMVLWLRVPSIQPAFTAKGAQDLGPAVALTCAGASLEACPRGSTLVFSVAGGEAPVFVSAYAEPVAGGERIWYLDNEAVSLPPAPATGVVSTPQILPRAARVGREHTAALYAVQVVVSTQPLSRAQAIAGGRPAVVTRARFQLQVVPP